MKIGRSILIHAVAIGALSGVAYWLSYDAMRHIAAMQAAQADKAAREAMESQLAILRAASGKANDLAPVIAAILPTQDALVDFPRETGALARQSGLDFSFGFGESVAGTTTTPGTVAFAMSGKGPALKWAEFLKAFESGANAVSVDVARMRSNDGKSYDMTINGKAFTQ